MIVYDYNGTGRWSYDAVLRRYTQYAQRFGVSDLTDLAPREYHENGKRWIFPVMYRVIQGIENDDPACVEIGVEFIEESDSFPFGRALKSNTARALRRATLNAEQRDRVRKRIAEMLCTGYLPREYRQYAKLGRKIGLKDWLARIKEEADLSNPWVRHYYEYFRESAAGEGRT